MTYEEKMGRIEEICRYLSKMDESQQARVVGFAAGLTTDTEMPVDYIEGYFKGIERSRSLKRGVTV